MLAASTDNTNSIPSIVQGCTVDCTGEQGWLVRAGSLLCMGYYWAGVTVIYNWGVKNQQPAASKYEMEDGWWKRWDRCMFIQRISEGGTKIFAELLTWTKCLVNWQAQNWSKHLKGYLGLSTHRWVTLFSCPDSLTAKLEFKHKEWLLTLETLHTIYQSDV